MHRVCQKKNKKIKIKVCRMSVDEGISIGICVCLLELRKGNVLVDLH